MKLVKEKAMREVKEAKRIVEEEINYKFRKSGKRRACFLLHIHAAALTNEEALRVGIVPREDALLKIGSAFDAASNIPIGLRLNDILDLIPTTILVLVACMKFSFVALEELKQQQQTDAERNKALLDILVKHEEGWKRTLTSTELQTNVKERKAETADKMKLVKEEAMREVKEAKRIVEEENELQI
eukprot:CAMPEP_0194443420 /NCGR_PEP_ID=MMETSP0176-20130528/126695_1 /TAXON_ID=216777 /ORGANISM="Proboscia alata, Strain PI-D3" /LENGTH=185 /DNA_ID=CAMNT_0039269663 /DNA_START=140 /DNA_END=699 /DNA_ORIENTATION=+